jgi:hypothetical protein
MNRPPFRYVVVLDQTPTTNVWKDGYFPRTFAQRKHASSLVKEVVSKGGKAHLEKVQP